MKPERRRQLGLATGVVLGATAIACLDARGCETFHARGPMNTGHAKVECSDCHREAPGTVRQQLQAAAGSVIASFDTSVVDVGYREVTSSECLECHERPDDRHPVFRFLEPRFATVREQIHPERCESCHREHAGVRVTIAPQTYCRHCHAETALEGDPVDVTHRDLIAAERWDTCLGCHDFHGNHAMKAPRRLADRIPADRIQAYFDGGPSPYGPVIRQPTEGKP